MELIISHHKLRKRNQTGYQRGAEGTPQRVVEMDRLASVRQMRTGAVRTTRWDRNGAVWHADEMFREQIPGVLIPRRNFSSDGTYT